MPLRLDDLLGRIPFDFLNSDLGRRPGRTVVSNELKDQ